VGEGYTPVRRGRDHTALGYEKGEAFREIYNGMGGDDEGERLKK